MTMSF